MNLYSIPKKTSYLPLLGFFIAVIAASALCYFAYDWSGNLQILSYFFPISESIWEYSKLCFYPLILVWLLSWMIWLRKDHTFLAVVQAACVSTGLCIYHTILGFFLLKYGLLISGFLVNLILLFSGILIGQTLGFYVLFRTNNYTYWSYLYLVFMIALFAIFTTYPPYLPLFQLMGN